MLCLYFSLYQYGVSSQETPLPVESQPPKPFSHPFSLGISPLSILSTSHTLFSLNALFFYGLFGWGGFGPRDLDLRTQIQIFCLDDLKSFGFGFGPNPSWISKAQIHGFQMTCIFNVSHGQFIP